MDNQVQTGNVGGYSDPSAKQWSPPKYEPFLNRLRGDAATLKRRLEITEALIAALLEHTDVAVALDDLWSNA